MLTSATLVAFMGITTSLVPDLEQVVDDAVAATNALVIERCQEKYTVLDPWLPTMEYAAKLQGARLVKRRASPEGVAGMGDFGPVRVSVLDPDIEGLLSPYLSMTFA